MEIFDLIDFILPRISQIFPRNKIKDDLFSTRNRDIVKNRYRGIGKCTISQIIDPEDLEKIYHYYLVWCKTNPSSRSSPKATASSNNNFQFIEYVNEFLYDPTSLPSSDKVSQYIERLKSSGWDHPIEIIVAYDTTQNIGLIVDGTNYALALDYLKQTDEERLRTLLQENDAVKLCLMKSTQCKNIFHYDFVNLISK
jgi:hypothetical protein